MPGNPSSIFKHATHQCSITNEQTWARISFQKGHQILQHTVFLRLFSDIQIDIHPTSGFYSLRSRDLWQEKGWWALLYDQHMVRQGKRTGTCKLLLPRFGILGNQMSPFLSSKRQFSWIIVMAVYIPPQADTKRAIKDLIGHWRNWRPHSQTQHSLLWCTFTKVIWEAYYQVITNTLTVYLM